PAWSRSRRRATRKHGPPSATCIRACCRTCFSIARRRTTSCATTAWRSARRIFSGRWIADPLPDPPPRGGTLQPRVHLPQAVGHHLHDLQGEVGRRLHHEEEALLGDHGER